MEDLKKAISDLTPAEPVEQRSAPTATRIGFEQTCRNLLGIEPGQRVPYRKIEFILRNYVDPASLKPGEFGDTCAALVDYDL